MNDSLKEKERIAIQRLKAFAPKDGDKYGCADEAYYIKFGYPEEAE